MHEIGRSKENSGHRKRGFRMILKVSPPPGWSAEDMSAVAIVARYHSGGIIPASHKMFQGMAAGARKQLLQLAGILRLANALAVATEPDDAQPLATVSDGLLTVAVPGLQVGPAGEHLAQAKYLLEATCEVAIRLKGVASRKRVTSMPRASDATKARG
jgi:exopolyphosphatase/pppGpp-phosphohydrolase